MSIPDVKELFARILGGDPRYSLEAYGFIREGLDFTVRRLDKPRHVSGQELLEGIRDYALSEFGPMTQTVLNEWGIRSTEDVGEIVFNMVENGLLGKTEEDNRMDFSGGYSFDEAFRKPFRPSRGS